MTTQTPKTMGMMGVAALALLAACSQDAETTAPAEGPEADAPAATEQADASEPRPTFPPEGVEALEHLQVRMRDGVRLHTNVYLPGDVEGPMPTVLVRTPYSTEMSPRSEVLKRLLSQGYAVVQQHERGRYWSEGDFTMLPRPDLDGWDTMDWITEQAWSDGNIGTMGCSSSAENQMQLAAAGHPAHKAMVAGSSGVGVGEAGPFKEQGNFWLGGVWQQGWSGYFSSSMHENFPNLPEGLSDEERSRLSAMFTIRNNGFSMSAEKHESSRMHLPMVEIVELLDAPQNEVEKYLTTGPGSDPLWQDNRVDEGEIITVPGLFLEAVYDLSTRSVAAYYEWNRQANIEETGSSPHHFLLTQGGHCSFGRESDDWKIGDMPLGDATFDHPGLVVGWFDQHLKGIEAAEKPAYRAYLGDGAWAEQDELPYGGGQTLRLGAGGGLAPESGVAESLSYTYDPADPVMSLGGNSSGLGADHEDGSFDQRPNMARDDVLTFETAPLEEPMDLLGFAEIGLTVSSDAPDTDFSVILMDIYPDGTAYHIGETILRMRYREGMESEVFMEEGETYDVTLPPILLTRRIEAGHKLGVTVASSNFPNYARSLNTAEDPYTSTDYQTAMNTVHVGEGTMSFIELPGTAE